MFTSLKRIIKTGWKSFFRGLGLNAATVFVMTMLIFLVTMLFIFNFASNIIISKVREKVDISVYFKEDVELEDALEFRAIIAQIPEVKDTEYVSKEQALEKFIERHKDDPVLMESLTEVGRNPFLDSLNIKAWQASQYNQVAKFLEDGAFKDLIEKVDYYRRKPVIEKVFSVTSGINRGAIIFGIILGLIAFLIAFNTIRIAINNSSEEVSVMRLVGASNWFIRGPFLVQGIIAGSLAILISLLMVFLVCYGLDAKIKILAPEVSIFELFISHFWTLLLVQFVVGIGLGTISSYVAIRKYLRI